jgi:DNA-3-methyladenine glycosylase
VRLGRRLPRSFYGRASTEVAPDLLGRVLVRRFEDGLRMVARIVEVEAYMEGDPASHSFRGRTARNEVMFGSPGHLYVYFTYGMHHCMNVVTGHEGEGSAVLLRAAEPLEGLDEMTINRGTLEPRRLCAGPGRFAQALGIDRRSNGADLARDLAIGLFEGVPVRPGMIGRSTRVGVTVGVQRRWRWFVRGDPFLSPGRPVGETGRRSRRGRR